MVNAAHRRERRLDQTVRERRVGRLFVHPLIGLEARIGLVLSDSIHRADRADRRRTCIAFGSNNNTVEKLDGIHGEDQ
jgi:hypothetical protein